MLVSLTKRVQRRCIASCTRTLTPLPPLRRPSAPSPTPPPKKDNRTCQISPLPFLFYNFFFTLAALAERFCPERTVLPFDATKSAPWPFCEHSEPWPTRFALLSMSRRAACIHLPTLPSTPGTCRVPFLKLLPLSSGLALNEHWWVFDAHPIACSPSSLF